MVPSKGFRMQRVGLGLDVHAFAPHRRLVLGGEVIEYSQGLLGHSDADVLLHALCDAMLGAAALGDIGTHFPSADVRYRDISSMTLLRRVTEMLGREGWKLVNADIVVACEEPRIAPYVAKMRANIADIAGCSAAALSVKATTTEQLGFIGRGEGIAAMAVVLVGK
jgi:2-C-methyl-D-erythritol 2,4-cyclodiphosphate synthase